MSTSRRRTLPPADLASSFRREGVRPLTRQTAPEAPEPEREHAQEQEQEQDVERPARRTTRRAPSRSSAPSGRLVLWTPVAVRARMQAVQSAHGTLYRDQVLDAIEEHVDELPDLVAAATGGDTAVRGRLFERRPVQRRPRAEQRVQLTIGGFLPSQLSIIDELVVSTGAASRSALVNAALDAALPAL